MRYIYWLLFFIVIMIFFLSSGNAQKGFLLINKVIVIDPGHGGVDPGAVYGNLYEKDLNLQISKKISAIIAEYGGIPILLRSDDYDLSSPSASYRKRSDFNNRISLINSSNADVYLSIHMNFLSDNGYFGPQVFSGKDDRKMALIVQKELNKVSNSDRNVKLIPDNTYMYKYLKMDGILIECGFLSNFNDRENLQTQEYQQKISEAIVRGLISYFN